MMIRSRYWNQNGSFGWSTMQTLIITMVIVCLGTIYLHQPNQETQSSSFLKKRKQFSHWRKGYLDIHHLRVGSSVSSFIIFPDGTTVLVDAGDMNYDEALARINEKQFSKIQAPFPDSTKTASEWIIAYLEHFSPTVRKEGLDYALLTHFHSDHMGTVRGPPWPLSKSGNFSKTGFTWVADEIRIKHMMDRGYPNYDYPVNLGEWNEDMKNYLKFVHEYNNSNSIQFEKFEVGNYTQIRPLHDEEGRYCAEPSSPNCIHRFRFRNLKANLDVGPACPDNMYSFQVPNANDLVQDGQWNENKLSMAFVIEYGKFRYYEGADQEHNDFEGSPGIDTVTPTAMAAGKVHVATMNHHGYGTNDAYFEYMDPRFVILQGWEVTQPPKMVSPVLQRHRHGRHFLATFSFPEALKDLEDVKFTATEGHIVVRAYEPSESSLSADQEYQVFVLDADRKIQSRSGPMKV